MYMSIRTLNYVIFSHQANLSKTTKHWDGFVSHCMVTNGIGQGNSLSMLLYILYNSDLLDILNNPLTEFIIGYVDDIATVTQKTVPMFGTFDCL